MPDDDFLRSVPLFVEFEADELEHLRSALHRTQFRAGDVILQEGNANRALHIVRSGRIRVSRQVQDREVTLCDLAAGQTFGVLLPRVTADRAPASEGAGWAAAAALAVAWGVGPLLPALVSGAIPGSPWTDLYPSVWGLGWFASHVGRVLPTFAPELAAPAGMPIPKPLDPPNSGEPPRKRLWRKIFAWRLSSV